MVQKSFSSLSSEFVSPNKDIDDALSDHFLKALLTL